MTLIVDFKISLNLMLSKRSGRSFKYRQLSRYSTARGSSFGLSLVGPTKVKARKFTTSIIKDVIYYKTSFMKIEI